MGLNLQMLDMVVGQMVARAVDVFRCDLKLEMVDDRIIRRMADLWCEQYNRPRIPTFTVHDACHYLLNQGPTGMGEALVLGFQSMHQLVDPNLIGALTVIVGGIGIAFQPGKKIIDRRIREERPKMRERVRIANTPAGVLG